MHTGTSTSTTTGTEEDADGRFEEESCVSISSVFLIESLLR